MHGANDCKPLAARPLAVRIATGHRRIMLLEGFRFQANERLEALSFRFAPSRLPKDKDKVMASRSAEVSRKTKETEIEVTVTVTYATA